MERTLQVLGIGKLNFLEKSTRGELAHAVHQRDEHSFEC